ARSTFRHHGAVYTLRRIWGNDDDLVALERCRKAEKAARHHGVLIGDDGKVRGVTAQRTHAKSLGLGTNDCRTLAPNAIVADPRRQLRIVDIKRRRLVLEVEHEAVDVSGAADDAER